MRAAVIGHPVDHSRSPDLHLRAYRILGLDIDYIRIDATAPEAPTLASRLREEPGWLGLSVTMPMKQPMLEQMDQADRLARTLGALNTVVVRAGEAGPALHGYNTDVAGVVSALRAAGHPGSRSTALILGAGGTAAAALAALGELGHVHVVVAARSEQRAGYLVGLGEELGVEVEIVSFQQLDLALQGRVGVVVSTLPAGAADPLAERVASLASHGSLLLDAAYATWPSVLSGAWREAGGTSVHGLAMLVHQAVEQVRLFTGRDQALDDDFRAALCDEVGITASGTDVLGVAG